MKSHTKSQCLNEFIVSVLGHIHSYPGTQTTPRTLVCSESMECCPVKTQ